MSSSCYGALEIVGLLLLLYSVYRASIASSGKIDHAAELGFAQSVLDLFLFPVKNVWLKFCYEWAFWASLAMRLKWCEFITSACCLRMMRAGSYMIFFIQFGDNIQTARQLRNAVLAKFFDKS